MEERKHQPDDDMGQVSEDIKCLPYYFPNLKTIDEVVSFLSPYIDQDGCFIVRNSVRRLGSLTISVIQGGGVKHINIGTHKGIYFLTNKKFNTVADLIKHYSEYEVPNRENISKVCLTKPLHFKDFDILTLEKKGWSPSWTMPCRPEMRPPPPLPHYISIRYAQVRDTDFDHSAELIAQLAQSEAAGYTDTCECGLRIEDAELPMGWTVHLTKPGEHERKAFFVTPTMESCWHLPKNIEVMVSSRQKAMLKDLGVI